MQQIITSLLDTDLYKFTMMQAALHQVKPTIVKYTLVNRPVGKPTPTRPNLMRLRDKLQDQIEGISNLRFTKEELSYLRTIPFFKPDFIDYLETFKLNRQNVKLGEDPTGNLSMEISGTWIGTILWEVPLLATISELYFQDMEVDYKLGADKLKEKTNLIRATSDNDFKIVEFGTRRRVSKFWQENVIATLASRIPFNLFGTSNVFFAKEYAIKCAGTMAHEWIQAHQALSSDLRNHQREAFENWTKEYRGDLGIALTDTISMDSFISDFDLYFAKLYDGFRQDSGDPIEVGDKMVAHYRSLDIDPKTKIAMFSNNLSVPEALKIRRYFDGKIKTSFGIGTNLTNDVGVTPLNIVIKMIECDHKPVAKLSDDVTKTICRDNEYLAKLRETFGLPAVTLPIPDAVPNASFD